MIKTEINCSDDTITVNGHEIYIDWDFMEFFTRDSAFDSLEEAIKYCMEQKK